MDGDARPSAGTNAEWTRGRPHGNCRWRARPIRTWPGHLLAPRPSQTRQQPRIGGSRSRWAVVSPRRLRISAAERAEVQRQNCDCVRPRRIRIVLCRTPHQGLALRTNYGPTTAGAFNWASKMHVTLRPLTSLRVGVALPALNARYYFVILGLIPVIRSLYTPITRDAVILDGGLVALEANGISSFADQQ